MSKSEIDELREALMASHIMDSSESLGSVVNTTPVSSPIDTKREAFVPISMFHSRRPITGNKRSRSATDSGMSLEELQKKLLGNNSDSSDDEMKELNIPQKRKKVKLKKKGGKRTQRRRRKNS